MKIRLKIITLLLIIQNIFALAPRTDTYQKSSLVNRDKVAKSINILFNSDSKLFSPPCLLVRKKIQGSILDDLTKITEKLKTYEHFLYLQPNVALHFTISALQLETGYPSIPESRDSIQSRYMPFERQIGEIKKYNGKISGILRLMSDGAIIFILDENCDFFHWIKKARDIFPPDEWKIPNICHMVVGRIKNFNFTANELSMISKLLDSNPISNSILNAGRLQFGQFSTMGEEEFEIININLQDDTDMISCELSV